jgi:integrase
MEQKPKLLEQVRAVARARRLSHRTEDTYHNFMKRFIPFHKKRHPKEMGADEITAFLTHLAARESISASTQNQAFFALLFLYRDVLQISLPRIEGVIRAKRPEHLPVVFTPHEAKAVLAQLTGMAFCAGITQLSQQFKKQLRNQ